MVLAALFLGHLVLLHAAWFPHFINNLTFYDLVSGWIPCLLGLGIIGTVLKHLNCDSPGCYRYGPHRTADRQHKLCRTHHPDLPNHRLSLAEIVERHHKHKRDHGLES